jgi:hypothetical protein
MQRNQAAATARAAFAAATAASPVAAAAPAAAAPSASVSGPVQAATSQTKRLTERIRLLQSWLNKHPDDAPVAALMSSSLVDLSDAKLVLEALRHPDARLQSCLSRQQGLTSKVAKLQSAQASCPKPRRSSSRCVLRAVPRRDPSTSSR